MAGFQFIDHTADIGIAAWGKDLKEAFAEAAYGMFSVIADLEGVTEGESRQVEVQAPDQEALLVEWLNELLYLFDVEHILFKRFHIQELEEGRLTARVYGEVVDPRRHNLKTGVKAATYHLVKVEREGHRYRVQVILDI